MSMATGWVAAGTGIVSSMTDPEHVYRHVMAVVERVETLLSSRANPIPVSDPGRADSPEPLTLATHHSYSLGMYARARSYFRGAILLARSGLADEALALGRSLFEEWLEEAALADGRSDSWWLHEVGDQMVHGNYFAHLMRQVAGEDGTALLALQTSEPRVLIDVVAYVVESVVVSHQSICAILGLPTMEELDELLSEVEELQAALSPP
jgi:hypothetical protein